MTETLVRPGVVCRHVNSYQTFAVICFDTLTPPILEEIDFNRPITGIEHEDNKKYRRRIGSLHADHAIVAPYAHQLRIVLYNDSNVDMAEKFMRLCEIAGLRRPIDCQEHRITIEVGRLEYFTTRKLYRVKSWLAKLDLFVAFQLEALLRSARLNTRELLGDLYASIVQLCRGHADAAGDVLRHFNEALDSRLQIESPIECFKRIRDRTLNNKRARLSPGNFYCHHVTFTPTRLIVEGPFATQSNRVIRRYPTFEENFLRVDFREEDSLHYHWSREVDATSFLNERVGGVLKDGFELAGRKFEFLAYSSSALREHAVWFVHPFQHPEEGYVTSKSIRDSLGDFSEYRRKPSKYAARMAQAFTATDPSVRIRRDEWEEIDDIGDFTDGVGTISTELGDRIWSALCASRRGHGVKPSVVSETTFVLTILIGLCPVSNSVSGI
jgi:RNA-dependent RNA polymerase